MKRLASGLPLLAAVTALFAAASAGVAQELRGIVLDEHGAPVQDVPLALHRISDDGGMLVADATSDAAGRFRMAIVGSADDGNIYFVTARYRGELYIGPTFRPPIPGDAEYVVQVGIEEASASAMMRGTGGVVVGPPPSPWRAALFGVFAIALLVAAALALRRVAGPAPRRRLLIRIARLDEEYAAAGPTDEYFAERERLLDRLRTAD